MTVSRRDALRIFDRHYGNPGLFIYEVGECAADVPYPFRPNTWFIRFSPDDAPMLRSSQLVCISKVDASIVLDGPAGDEG
jgi:hypothetical protein